MKNSPKQPHGLARLFLEEDGSRLRSGWRILGQLCMLIFFLTITGVPAGLLLLLNPPALLALGIGEAATFLAIFLAVYLARRLLDRRSFTSLGLVWHRFAARDLLAGVLIPAGMIGLIYLLEAAFGWLQFEHFAWDQTSPLRLLAELLALFGIFIVTGLVEELQARGYWLHNLEEGMGLFWAMLLSSIMFALLHSLNPNVSWIAILGLVAAGLFLAYGFVRTRQLWLPIGLHLGWNFFEGPIFGFQVSGLDVGTRLLVHIDRGPALFTGGAFGPEAGLVQFPALLLGVLFIYLYTRGRRNQQPDQPKLFHPDQDAQP